MAKRTISRVLDYFLSPAQAWMFAPDVHRAMTEFLGHPGTLPMTAMPHFAEWFLYDFSLREGMTPLCYFCTKNPLNLAVEELQFYQELAGDNHFDFFEVVDLDKGAGSMTLVSARTGERFAVQHRKAVQDSVVGEVTVCRIGRVSDHYELTGVDALSMDKPSRRDKRMMKSLAAIDPRIAYHTIVAPQERMSPVEFQARDLGGGAALMTGVRGDMPTEGYDDCAVCRLMKQAKAENRSPSQEEIERAMGEANKEQHG